MIPVAGARQLAAVHDMDEPGRLVAILAALEDEAPVVREQAVRYAARYLEPARLVRLVANDERAVLRNGAIAALERQGPCAVRPLEMVLAAPLSRARWAIAGGTGMLVSVVLFMVLTMAGIAIGVATTDSDVATPVVGSLVLAMYAAALVGIGHAVGGVLGMRFAGTVVVVFVVVTWFIQLLGPLLGLPQFVQDLALTSHFGQPMVGRWDSVGIAASLVLAIGGLALGTWGFRGRDLRC